jgi:sugar (pentulose or hexulose) kinase
VAIVGIDIGTQGLKAIVVDEDLRPIGDASIFHRPSFLVRPEWSRTAHSGSPRCGQPSDAARG